LVLFRFSCHFTPPDMGAATPIPNEPLYIRFVFLKLQVCFRLCPTSRPRLIMAPLPSGQSAEDVHKGLSPSSNAPAGRTSKTPRQKTGSFMSKCCSAFFIMEQVTILCLQLHLFPCAARKSQWQDSVSVAVGRNPTSATSLARPSGRPGERGVHHDARCGSAGS